MRVSRSALLAAIKAVLPACAVRSARPVLECIRLQMEGSMLRLDATNLTMSLAVLAPVGLDADPDLAINAPGKLLEEVVSRFTEEDLNLEVNRTTWTLTLRAGKAEVEIKGIDAQEFPPAPRIEPTGGALPWNEIEKRIAWCRSTEEVARPVLSSVQVVLHAGRITACALDGFRLGVYEADGEGEGSVLLPSKAIGQFARIGAGLAVRNGEAWVCNGTMLARCSLVDGQYPDYRTVVPSTFARRITFNSEEMAAAVRLIRAVGGMPVVLTGVEGALRVSGADDGLGSGAVEVPCEGAINLSLKVVYNSTLFLDILNHAGKRTEMGFNNEKSAVVFRNPEDGSCFYVLMPLVRSA